MGNDKVKMNSKLNSKFMILNKLRILNLIGLLLIRNFIVISAVELVMNSKFNWLLI